MVLSDSEKPKSLGNKKVSNHCVAVVLNMKIHCILVNRSVVYPEKTAVR